MIAAPGSDKSTLRKQLRVARSRLSPMQRRHAVAAFTRNVIRSGLLLRYRRIGFYASMPNELDLWPLINAALRLRRQCYLPVVPKGRGKRMHFTQLHAANTWYLNRYRIPELAAPHRYSARSLDLVFVPLLGFDLSGNRLGMGGGYYDATLAFLHHRRVWRKPILAGAAFECQKLTCLPCDDWDQPLDLVLTEAALYRFSRRR